MEPKPFDATWIEARRKTLAGMAKMLARQPRTDDPVELERRREREEFIEHESRWLATVAALRTRATAAEGALARGAREAAEYVDAVWRKNVDGTTWHPIRLPLLREAVTAALLAAAPAERGEACDA